MLGLVAAQSKTGTLRLILKHTSYSEYIATRDVAFDTTHPGVERANPLGLTVIPISADNWVIATRRSPSADQNPSLPYFVGGYVEPPRTPDLTGIISFNFARELNEEVGVSPSSLVVTGLATDPVHHHPELFAVTRMATLAAELRTSWRMARDKHEASEVILLPLFKLLTEPHYSFFPEGVTWSFSLATLLLKRCWAKLEPLL